MLTDVQVIEFDAVCAREFGKVRGTLLQQGIVVSPVDLMIAAVALTHDLSLVTGNLKCFARIPQLRVENWLDG